MAGRNKNNKNSNNDDETTAKIRHLEKELFETRHSFALKQDELNGLQALLEKFMAPDEDTDKLQQKFEGLTQQLEYTKKHHAARTTEENARLQQENARLKKQVEYLQDELAVKDQKLMAYEVQALHESTQSQVTQDDISTSTPLLDTLQQQAEKLLMAKESESVSGDGKSSITSSLRRAVAKKPHKPSSLKRAMKGESAAPAMDPRLQQLQAAALAQLQEQASLSGSPAEDASHVDKEEALQLKEKYLKLKDRLHKVEKEKQKLEKLLEQQQAEQDVMVTKLTDKLEKVLTALQTVTEEKEALVVELKKQQQQPANKRLSATAPVFQPRAASNAAPPPLIDSTQQLQLANTKVKQLKKEAQQLRETVQNAGAEQQLAQARVKELQDELKKSQARSQQQLTNSQHQLKETQQQLKDSQQLLEETFQQLQQAQGQLIVGKGEELDVERLQTQFIEQLEDQLNESHKQLDETVQSDSQRIQQLQLQIRHLQDQAAVATLQHDKHLSQMKQESSRLKESLQQAIAEKEQLQTEKESAVKENETLAKDLAAATVELRALEADQRNTKAAYTVPQLMSTPTKRRSSDTDDDDEEEEVFNTPRSSPGTSLSRAIDVSKAAQLHVSKAAKLQRENKDLQEQLTQVKAENQILKDNLSSLQEEAKAKSEESIQAKTKEIDHLKGQIFTMRKQSTHKEKLLETQGKDLDEFKTSVRKQIQQGLEQNQHLQYQLVAMHEAMAQKDTLLRQQEEEYEAFQVTVGSQIQSLVRGGAGANGNMGEESGEEEEENNSEQIASLQLEVTQKEKSIVTLHEQLAQKNRELESNNNNKLKQLVALQEEVAEKEESVLALHEQLAEKEMQLEDTANSKGQELVEVQEELSQKEQSLLDLLEQLEEKDRQISEETAALIGELAQKEQSIVALHEQLAEKDLQIDEFEAFQATAESQMQKLIQDRGAESKEKDAIATLQEEVAGKEQHITALHEQLAEKNAQIKEFEAFQATTESQIQKLIQDRGTELEAIAALQEEVAGKEQSITALHEQLAEKNARIEEFEAFQATAESQLQTLIQSRSADSDDGATIATLQEDLAGKEHSIKALQDELTFKKSQIEEFEAFQATAESQIHKLIQGRSVDSDSDDGNDKEEQIKALQEQLAEKNKQVEEFEVFQATAEMQIQNLVRRGSVKADNSDGNGDKGEDIAALKEEVSIKQQSIMDLHKQLSEKNAQIEDFEALQATVELQIQSLVKGRGNEHAAGEGDEALKSLVAMKDKEIVDLEDQLEEKDQKIKEQEKQFESFQATVEMQMFNLVKSGSAEVNEEGENEGLDMSLRDALNASNRQLEQQTEQLKSYTINANTQIRKKTQEIQQMQAKLSELQEHLSEKELLLEQSERLESARALPRPTESTKSELSFQTAPIDNRTALLQETLNYKEHEVSSLQKSLNAKERELYEHRGKLEAVGVKEKALEQAKKELEAEVKETSEENIRLMKELSSLKVELSRQQEQTATNPDQESVVTVLKQTIAAKQQELDEVRAKLQDSAEVRSRLAGEVEALKEEIRKVEQKEAESLNDEAFETFKEVLQTQLKQKIAENDNLKEVNARLKEDFAAKDRLIVTAEEHDQQLYQLQQDIRGRDEEISKLKGNIDKLRQQHAGDTVAGGTSLSTTQAEMTSQTLEELHVEVEELKEVIRTNEEVKNEKIGELEDIIRSKDDDMKSLGARNNAELRQLRKQLERTATGSEERKEQDDSQRTRTLAMISDGLDFVAQHVAKNMASFMEAHHKAMAELVLSIAGDDVVAANEALSQLTNILNKEKEGQDIRVALFRSGGHLVIISTMNRFRSSADIQEEGCRALSAFAVLNKSLSYSAVGGMGSICIGLAAAGALESIFGAMDAFPDDARLHKRGFRALNNLISSKDLVPLFFDMNLFTPLSNHMANFPDDPSIQEDGCRIMRFTSAYPRAREAFKKDGALRILAGVLERFDQKSGAYKQALRTWNSLLLGK